MSELVSRLKVFFSFYIVGYLNEFHSLVLLQKYNKIFKASRLSYLNFAKMHILVLQTLLKCMFYMNQLNECLFNRVWG